MSDSNLGPIWEEVNSIAADCKHRSVRWRVTLLVEDVPVEVYRVRSLTVLSDYNNEFSDTLIVQVSVGRGSFDHVIYPKKDHLKVTIERAIIEDEREDEEYMAFEQQEMTAILLDRSSTVIQGPIPQLSTEYGGNITQGLYDINLQLLNPAIETLRLRKLGGVFRGKTLMETLRYLFTRESLGLETDQENQIKGVDIVEPDNNEPRQHVNIPHGLPLIEIPDYLQNRNGGIYNAGLGFYLFRKHWYFYPLYDNTRFEKTDKRTLTVVNIPEYMLSEYDRTYRVTDKQLIVMGNGATSQLNKADLNQKNVGNGVRFLDSRRPLNDIVEVKDNVANIQRKKNNHEVMSEDDNTTYNHIPVSDNVLTDNPFRERSLLAARMGMTLAVSWRHADPAYLYPGMPVRFMYSEDGEMRELFGTLLGMKAYYSTQQEAFAPAIHHCNTVLLLFLQQRDDFTGNNAIA